MGSITKKLKFLKTIKNLINKIFKGILYFILPKEDLRNIEGIYQLILVFGLILVSFRFLILDNLLDITKNGLVFICLFLIVIFDKLLTKEK